MKRKITPSEIIFATNFCILDKEKISEYTAKVKKIFSKFYRFNDADIDNLIKIEKLKINMRGKDINYYLFSPKLSLDDKLTIIEDFYNNDAFWLFTISEIFIAFNISWKILWKLEESQSKTKNPEKLQIIQRNIDFFEKIIEEAFLQTNVICLYNENCRFMYGNAYMPTDLEEINIKEFSKQLIKK